MKIVVPSERYALALICVSRQRSNLEGCVRTNPATEMPQEILWSGRVDKTLKQRNQHAKASETMRIAPSQSPVVNQAFLTFSDPTSDKKSESFFVGEYVDEHSKLRVVFCNWYGSRGW